MSDSELSLQKLAERLPHEAARRVDEALADGKELEAALAEIDAHALLEAHVGEGATLSDAEAEQMFESLEAALEPPANVVPLGVAWRPRFLAAAGFLVVALGAAWWWSASSTVESPPYETIKGPGSFAKARAKLLPFFRVGDGKATPLQQPNVTVDAQLLFRFVVSQPSHLVLHLEDDRGSRVLWSGYMNVGEHELNEDGRALVLTPHPGEALITLISSPTKIDASLPDHIESVVPNRTACTLSQIRIVAAR